MTTVLHPKSSAYGELSSRNADQMRSRRSNTSSTVPLRPYPNSRKKRFTTGLAVLATAGAATWCWQMLIRIRRSLPTAAVL